MKAYKFPIFIENSRVPVFLSKFAPIDIWAISFGVWVWCRGEMSEKTKRHEAIHYLQQVELLFVFQWVLYLLFFLRGLIKEKSGKNAYRQNPFELEAYDKESDLDYRSSRKPYSWVKYI